MQKISDEAREKRNAYYRQWRKTHKDSVRETNRRYWEKVLERYHAEQDTANDEESGNG